jgi:predicted DNA binding CopG/RHH family protein
MKKLNNKELETKFDSCDIGDYLDTSTAKIISPQKTKRVNVDFPEQLLKEIDQEAEYVGVPRQSILKLWIAERIEQNKRNRLQPHI